MEITRQILIDASQGALSDSEHYSLVQSVRALPLPELLKVIAQTGLNLTGDGIIVGNNNVNVVIKGELGQILTEAVTRRQALFQLPAPVIDFVGRHQEIERINNALRSGAAIIGISGMAGTGKTELAFQESFRAHFPDGQLIVNMRGTDQKPLTATDALSECIRALLGTETKLPSNIDQLEKLYRSLLNDRAVFICLDNVADSAQVFPLRPPKNCAMVVTSRSPIVLPGITTMTLGELSPDEAQDLLLRIVPVINRGVAATICELCGYLPLAIRAGGSLLAITPDLDASDFARELREERTRLEKLGTEGVDIGVEASFNLSYARLSAEASSIFRQLSFFPASFDCYAEEFVCADDQHKQLSDLVRRSLVLFDINARRYRLHELMRVFARTLVDDAENSVAGLKFAEYYLNVLKKANHLYLKSGHEHSDGMQTFNQEAQNIRFGQHWCSERAQVSDEAAQICWSYTSWGGNVLLNHLPADELKSWCQESISIAKHFNNRAGELGPVTLLGLVQQSLGEYSLAEEHFRQAIDIAQETKDPAGAAVCHQHLGRTLSDTGRLYEAIEQFEKAKQLWCDLGQHEKEGTIVSDIGLAYSDLKESNRAIQYLDLVLKNARKDRNELDEANALANLANAYSKRDRARAIQLSEQAAEIFEHLGYRHWAAQTSASSGLWLVDNGEPTKGISRIQASISTLRELGDRPLEVVAVGQLGEAYMTLNDPHNAIIAFDHQLELAREIGDLHREANALGDKAIMLLDIGEMDLAMVAFDEARRVAQLTGNLNHEFNTLCKRGEAYAKANMRDQAIKAFGDQVEIGKSMGVVSKELHALKHLADSFAGWGDTERAREYMETRTTISERSKDSHDYPDSVLEFAEFLAETADLTDAIASAKIALASFEGNRDASCALKVQLKIDEWQRFSPAKATSTV